MSNLTCIADYLSECLKQLDFLIMSQNSGKGLPLVAFRLNPASQKHFDEFAIAHQLRSRGWIIPAYTMAPHTNNLKMLRIVIREGFSKSRCEQLLQDIKLCLKTMDSLNREDILKSQTFNYKQSMHGSKAKHSHLDYKNEKHSLKGKTGKIHAVC